MNLELPGDEDEASGAMSPNLSGPSYVAVSLTTVSAVQCQINNLESSPEPEPCGPQFTLWEW